VERTLARTLEFLLRDGWHGNDVVGSSTVVVVAPLDTDVDAPDVDVVVVTSPLLPPHAASSNAALHPAITARRTGLRTAVCTAPSWHP